MQKSSHDNSTSTPVGVLEEYFRSVGTDTSSSKGTPSEDNVDNHHNYNKITKTGSRWRGVVGLFKSKYSKEMPQFVVDHEPKLSRWRSRSFRENNISVPFSSNVGLNCFDSGFRVFSLDQLQLATANFSPGTLFFNMLLISAFYKIG